MLLRTDRLRESREQRGWSQRELARLCDLGENQIHRYEAGKADPSATHLRLIADRLGVSTDYLLGLSDNPRGQLGDSELNEDERAVLEAFRRDQWSGVVKLGVDRLAEKSSG
jgi:transcriptional regulator with XRE-family HTH domain